MSGELPISPFDYNWRCSEQDHAAAAELANRLVPVAHLAMVDVFGGCVARLVGGAARLNGDVDGARAAFEQAVAVCQRVRFRPEMTLARVDLAEVRLGHFPADRAPRWRICGLRRSNCGPEHAACARPY
jgi:hypothetical protein